MKQNIATALNLLCILASVWILIWSLEQRREADDALFAIVKHAVEIQRENAATLKALEQIRDLSRHPAQE